MISNLQKAITSKGRFLPQLDIPGAFPHSPTISLEETRLVEELLEKDAASHHIFYSDKGFHNHLTHMLLADYSLGASTRRLQEIYEHQEKIQRPKPPKHDDFKWTEHLGDDKYYADYLDFMIEEIEKLGRVGAVEKYVFEEKNNMLSRFLGGAYHPYIHTGYGLEFGIDGMVAEGLAQMCVHSDRSKPLCPNETKLSENPSSKTALELAKEMLEDKRLDGLIKYTDEVKFFAVVDKKPEVVLEYVENWSLSLDKEKLLEKASELMVLAAAVYGGPQRPNKEIVFDFFLMHALTSSIFLPTFVQHIDPELSVRFLQAKFAVDLGRTISQGRPKLHLEQFTSSKAEFTKSWREIFELAVNHRDEHLPKAIRALKQVERWDPKETLGKGVYRKMASMTVESIIAEDEEEKDGKRFWNSEGIGFDETWAKIPVRKPVEL